MDQSRNPKFICPLHVGEYNSDGALTKFSDFSPGLYPDHLTPPSSQKPEQRHHSQQVANSSATANALVVQKTHNSLKNSSSAPSVPIATNVLPKATAANALSAMTDLKATSVVKSNSASTLTGGLLQSVSSNSTSLSGQASYTPANAISTTEIVKTNTAACAVIGTVACKKCAKNVKRRHVGTWGKFLISYQFCFICN